MLPKILRFAMDSVLYYCVPMNRRAFTLRPTVVIVNTTTITIVIFYLKVITFVEFGVGWSSGSRAKDHDEQKETAFRYMYNGLCLRLLRQLR